MRKIPTQGATSPFRSDYYAAVKNIYSGYRGKARARGMRWKLPLAAFVALLQRDCVYCGAPPANTFVRGKALSKYQGIDRIESSKGYYLGNVVPCCAKCNRLKSDILSGAEMALVMDMVKEFRKNYLPKR